MAYHLAVHQVSDPEVMQLIPFWSSFCELLSAFVAFTATGSKEREAFQNTQALLVLCSPVQNIQSKVDAPCLQRPWSLADRRQQLAEDEALQQYNQSAKEHGTSRRFFWRSLYLPEQGMFCQAPKDLQLGTRQKVRVMPAWNSTAFSSDAMQFARQFALQCL